MYGAGIVFLAYCYLFQVHPGWFNSLVKKAQKKNWISGSTVGLSAKSQQQNYL
jgi:hypothetical protein